MKKLVHSKNYLQDNVPSSHHQLDVLQFLGQIEYLQDRLADELNNFSRGPLAFNDLIVWASFRIFFLNNAV